MTNNNSSWPHVEYAFSGLRVLVTGGTSGIGAAIELAEFLAERRREVTILEESGTLG